MRYSAKIPDDSVNVSNKSPLLELLWMSVVLAVVLLSIYITLGMAVDRVATTISPKTESWIWKKLGTNTLFSPDDNRSGHLIAQEKKMQNLLDRLLANSPLKERGFTVTLVDMDIINAAAIPGGRIILFKGLIDKVKSENELAFLLGHEIGHFVSRDHLKGLGRALVFMSITMTLFGEENIFNDMISGMISIAEFKFSRSQEGAADVIGLERLVATYGHAGGATDFFSRIGKNRTQNKWAAFLRTHPHLKKRIESIEKLIRKREYPVRKTTALILSKN